MAEDYGESIAATMRNPGTMVFRPNHKMHHGREFMTPVKYQGNTVDCIAAKLSVVAKRFKDVKVARRGGGGGGRGVGGRARVGARGSRSRSRGRREEVAPPAEQVIALPFSSQELYDCVPRGSQNSTRHSLGVSHALRYVTENGVFSESKYPRLEQYSHRDYCHCAEIVGRKIFVTGWDHLHDEDAIKAALDVQPVIACTYHNSISGFMHAQPSDICYPGALPQLTPRIGHVMLVVGYGYDVQGVLYFVFSAAGFLFMNCYLHCSIDPFLSTCLHFLVARLTAVNGESAADPYTPKAPSPEFRGRFGSGLLDLHAKDGAALLTEEDVKFACLALIVEQVTSLAFLLLLVNFKCVCFSGYCFCYCHENWDERGPDSCGIDWVKFLPVINCANFVSVSRRCYEEPQESITLDASRRAVEEDSTSYLPSSDFDKQPSRVGSVHAVNVWDERGTNSGCIEMQQLADVDNLEVTYRLMERRNSGQPSGLLARCQYLDEGTSLGFHWKEPILLGFKVGFHGKEAGDVIYLGRLNIVRITKGRDISKVCVVYMEMVESGSSSQGGGYMSEEFKEWIKQGNGYAMGLLPSTDWIGPMRLEDVELPEGAPAEYHYDFNDIWRRYCLQINYTNGMDVDTYPGPSMEAETGPLDLSIPKEELEGFWRKQYELRIELAEFAINQYNEESNFFKYELVKIEKANFRLSGYSEFFMTVKVRNVTVGTVVETFHIHVGSQHGDLHKEVFSCLPKGGALSSRSVWKRKRNRLERESGTSGT
ncbi:hypothetical protein FXO37_31265 [Capsicum annuum]|nr:hypothetical protein FXO37_31265 [Capsicum annuum]